MDAQLLLSIAIPTYNRSQSLALLLTSICQQVKASQSAQLEVLIFDNCSPDDTTEVCKPFVSNYGFVRYISHETNIGADNNFVSAFNGAQGKYLWVIGDDELLFDGAIDWVMATCGSTDFGCAYIYSVPDTLQNVHGYLGQSANQDIHVAAYAPWQFARATNYRLTFLSGSVVNREAVLKTNPQISNDMAHFSASNLVHLTWILSAVKSMPRSLIVTTPLFASTVANSGGYSPVKVFVVNLSELFDYYFAKLEPAAKSFIRWFALIGWFPKVVYDCRFSDKYQSTGYKIAANEFPLEMRHGVSWKLFDDGILNGPKPLAFVALLALKLAHRVLQSVYLKRSIA